MFRRQVGLPLDKPIVMTGHQAMIWGPGVLAKFIACEAAAQSLGGAAAWIVPDQDEARHGALRVPVRTSDGALETQTLTIDEPPPRAAAASCPPFLPPASASSIEPALPSVAEGLDRTLAALAERSGEPTAATQVQTAVEDLLSPLAAPAPTLLASRLHETDLFAELVERLRQDARRAARSYNDAVAARPEADLAPLLCGRGGGRCELPLWRLAFGEPRRPVFAETIGEVPLEQLAPRALLMTGLLRLAGCDLFIHGTGGAAYDRATETWFQDWLGEDLAPQVVATATLTLPLPEASMAPEAASKAAWRAHHARHHPAALGDEEKEREKMRLVEAIRQAKARGEDPAELFRDMHELLTAQREEHAPELERLDRDARRARAAATSRDVAQDRTWPFPWHAQEDLSRLDRAVRDAFADVGAASAR